MQFLLAAALPIDLPDAGIGLPPCGDGRCHTHARIFDDAAGFDAADMHASVLDADGACGNGALPFPPSPFGHAQPTEVEGLF